ncbi:MAG TPA: MBL fold metallo-hydrolase [Nitrososphaeraceae archaeon]|jgi:glyoxylase-like metal-dependent hydrolase (beta-lactamase superfamily II)|nr:MBL fold metallo-hydrolase [Nitrososphaeraceae archaeon]
MKSKSITKKVLKNTIFVGSIILIFVFLDYIANQNFIRAQAVNEKGYDLKEIGKGAFAVSSNGYNSMFLVTGEGVIVVDAPPNIGDKIFNAISEVTNESIKYLIYSHAHKDHIGGAHLFPPGIEIIAQKDTSDFLKMANHTDRPLPTQIFVNGTTLTLGNTTLQLSYGGPYHQNGNIFIYAPQQKILMVVDQFSPGGTPWKHLATTPHVPSYIQSYDQVLNHDFDVYISGHGIGTKDDVQLEKSYVDDLKNNAGYAISNVNFTEATKNVDKNNTAAVTEAYFNAMTGVCVDKTDGKWKGKLQGVGVWTDEHCEKMIISLRND